MPPLGLSTAHELGLGLAALVFVVFALASALLIPRWNPQFPGRWLRGFVALTVVLFVGMLAAVEIFGAESKSESAHAEPGAATTAQAEGQPPASTAQTGTNAPATTSAGTVARTVKVSETEFKIALDSKPTAPGSYEFDLSNDGKIDHDLVVNGPGVDNAATPVIKPGSTATLKVALQKGTYDLYCSVPGHKAAGMDLKIAVS